MTSPQGAPSAATRLSHDAARTLGRQGLATVLAIGLSVLLARALGPSGSGAYALAILVITVLASIFNLGLTPANVYFVGIGAVSITSARRLSLRVGLTASAAVIAVGCCLLAFHLLEPRPLSAVDLALALFCFPLALVQQLLASLLQGKSQFRTLNRVMLAAPVTTLVLVIAGVSLSAMTIIVALFAYGMGLTVGLGLTWRSLVALESGLEASPGSGLPPRRQSDGSYLRRALSYGWKAQLSNSITTLVYRLDLLLVGALISTGAVGIYAVATQVAERLWLPSQAISTVLLPRLAQLHDAEDLRRDLTPKVSRWTLSLCAVGALLVACVAKPLVELAYGSAFQDAVIPLLILLPGVMMLSVTRVLANDLAARGRPGLNLAVSLVTLLANILANFLLIPLLGISGAALASSLAYTLETVLLVAIYARMTHTAPMCCLVVTRSDARWIKGFLAGLRGEMKNSG